MSNSRVYPAELMPLATRDHHRLVLMVARSGKADAAEWMFFPGKDLVKAEVLSVKDNVFYDGVWFEDYMLHQAMADAHMAFRKRLLANGPHHLEDVVLDAENLTEAFRSLGSAASKIEFLFKQLTSLAGLYRELEKSYQLLEHLVDTIGNRGET